MKTIQATVLGLVPALLAGSAVAGSCNADNCLRALRATQIPGRLQDSQAFCSAYTAGGAATPTVPAYAAKACVSNQVGPESVRLSSACACIATSTAAVTVPATATPTSSSNACAIASSSWSALASVTATPRIPAAVAHECLSSVPLHKDEAIELVDAIVPYLEWQSDAAYKADPPADYFYKPYDMFAALAEVRANLEGNLYESEYAFQSDLYLKVFAQGHDGHFVYYPDLLTGVFDFGRQHSLVSISEDGKSLPVIKVYDDVIASPSTAPAVVLINGVDAAKYIEETIYVASFNQDPDAAYNSMFFSKAVFGSTDGSGYFSSGGRIRFNYQGPNTTLTFSNKTEITYENYARVRGSLAGITDGESMYSKFCNGSAADAAKANTNSAESAKSDLVQGYPEPVVITSDGIVSCYYLDGAGFEDVVVLSLLAFESESPAEFQAVTQQCISKALTAGKTKLVVDFSANGGGYILQGYDFFRQLFPHILQDGFSRWKANDGFLAMAQIYSDLVAGLDPETSSNADLIGDYENWFDYHYDYNLTNQPFQTFDDKFSPHIYKDTRYTALMRWNLDDPLTTVNSTFGMGMEISGYGSLANLTQPFAAEDIVLLYDGFCASTCTLASEMLRIQAGVRSVAMGGRPIEGSIQGVGGIKGAQTLGFSSVYNIVSDGLLHTENDDQKAALSRYSHLPMSRSTAAALNTRDQILRDNVEDGLPAQFVVEPADCRLYWTADMVSDITAVWKGAAQAAFNGGSCAAGSIPQPKKARSPSRIERQRRTSPPPANIGQGRFNFKQIERDLKSRGLEEKFKEMYSFKAIE